MGKCLTLRFMDNENKQRRDFNSLTSEGGGHLREVLYEVFKL